MAAPVLRSLRVAAEFDASPEAWTASWTTHDGGRLRRLLKAGGVRERMYLITTLLPSSSDPQALINRMLPKELLLRVFSYLDVISLCRCAQTCRHWNCLALDGSNWQHVDLFSFQKDIKAPVVENLARRCGGFLKNLSLRGCENVQDNALRSFTHKCPNIESLSLSKCKRVTDITCENLGRFCRRLTRLDLENCTSITDRAMRFIGDGCQNLEYLNISWCENIQDRGLVFIANGCPRLEELVLKGCEGVSLPSAVLLTPVSAQRELLPRPAQRETLQQPEEAQPPWLFYHRRHRGEGGRAVSPPRLLVPLDVHANHRRQHRLPLPQLQPAQGPGALRLFAPIGHRLRLSGQVLPRPGKHGPGGLQSHHRRHHQQPPQRMPQPRESVLWHRTLRRRAGHGSSKKHSDVADPVTLSHCELVTDAGLEQLCSSHRNCLRVLELDNCPLVTDNTLDVFRTMGAQLERIELFDCPSVTKDGIARFKQFRPDVEVHAYFAPSTPPASQQPSRNAICRCCVIL
uniref:F-box domain-containing protein n=1 Tax=Steinernema glaseri TaxID=37863 RepID=A0A1I7Y202_9BILA